MSPSCQVCKSRPAQIHFTEIVNNNMVTLNLCTECAEEKGIDVQSSGPYGIGDLVAGLIDTSSGSEAERIGRVRCPRCSYEYSDFKKLGRFGCPDCYLAFEAQLVPLLRHVHGSVQHDGKVPQSAGHRVVREQRVNHLRDELSKAVDLEDYERAATLRDEIRRFEGDSDEAGEGHV